MACPSPAKNDRHYIAATTAFLVVNLPQDILPGYLNFIPWLTPTVILVPLIFKWTRKYEVKKETC